MQSLNFSRIGAELRAADGQYEDAATELLMVVQSICRYLWTFRLLKATGLDKKLPDSAGAALKTDSSPYQQHLAAVGARSLKDAYSWLEQASGGFRHEPDKIASAELITQACSLALVVQRW